MNGIRTVRRVAQELALMAVGSGLFVAAVHNFGAPNGSPTFAEEPSYYLSGVIVGAGIGYALRFGWRWAARRYRNKPAKLDVG